MKIFVSGKWDDRERIHQQICQLQESGEFQVTHDWTQVEQKNRTPVDGFGIHRVTTTLQAYGNYI